VNALKARIQGEKRKELWLEARIRWKQGDGGKQRDIESFRKGEEYSEGLYRQWVGYIEPREENWREENWRKESWKDYIGPQVRWKGQETPQREQEDSTDRSDAWDGSMDRGDGWGAL
jgi:hypothetical protein